MDLSLVNWIAVVAAAMAGFAFGAVYYTALGKHWMDAASMTEADAKKRSPAPFIISFAGLLVTASVLAGHFVRHEPGLMSAVHAVESAVVLWIGFVVTTTATNNAFRQAKPKLTVIDSVHWLGVLVIQGLVINAF